MVESCEDEYLRFDLEYQQVQFSFLPHLSRVFKKFRLIFLSVLCRQVVVLKTKTAKVATSDILTTHCIPSAMSDDLKA